MTIFRFRQTYDFKIAKKKSICLCELSIFLTNICKLSFDISIGMLIYCAYLDKIL